MEGSGDDSGDYNAFFTDVLSQEVRSNLDPDLVLKVKDAFDGLVFDPCRKVSKCDVIARQRKLILILILILRRLGDVIRRLVRFALAVKLYLSFSGITADTLSAYSAVIPATALTLTLSGSNYTGSLPVATPVPIPNGTVVKSAQFISNTDSPATTSYNTVTLNGANVTGTYSNGIVSFSIPAAALTSYLEIAPVSTSPTLIFSIPAGSPLATTNGYPTQMTFYF